MPSIRLLSLFILPPTLYTIWIFKVNEMVTAPYLDEYFHIRQAQAYCKHGRYAEWDPKITTPPGLYFISYCLSLLRSFVGSFLRAGWDSAGEEEGCTVSSLRFLNTFTAGLVLPFQISGLRRGISGVGERRVSGAATTDWRSVDGFHHVVNICLFPLVFFFSALYYTDICSLSFVLGAFQCHRRSIGVDGSGGLLDGFKIFVLGVGALSMRQTNIFWVAVFLAAPQAVRDVKHSTRSSSRPYDPPVREAYLEDYLQTGFSLATAALKEPIILLLGSLWPYIALLASFAVFVLLNGGVVLGDKENHVASIHIPQMLYIWPYIVFFSWPVILPHVLHALSQRGKGSLPRPLVAIPIMALMTLAVHFNTIIHPFTLADNRHYVFYVFRLLLKHPTVKFAAVPVYFCCAWATITALDSGYNSKPMPRLSREQKSNSSRFEAKEKAPSPPLASSSRPSGVGEDEDPTHTSFLIIYLLSTTLSLITAPLVEPRYLIIPWLIWRLHVQLPSPSSSSSLSSLSASVRGRTPHQPEEAEPQREPGIVTRWLDRILQLDQSVWLALETVWLILVNAVTCWMFLYRGFQWAGEPGVVQRFMW